MVAKKQLATSNKTAGRDLDAFWDDDPTAELPVTTEANVAAMEALHGDFDECPSTATDELEAHVKLGELQSELGELRSEIERLRSGAIKLDSENKALDTENRALDTENRALASENRAFEKQRAEIADELEEATERNAELTALLSQRDDELAALKVTLAATNEAEKDPQSSLAPSQPEFDEGETRKLVGHGDYSSHEIELRPGRTSLGSAADNDVSIDASFISRHHLQVLSGSSETILRDMNSTNGTYVNSRRIRRCALRDGDLITIGTLRFTFVMQRSAASASHTMAPTPTPTPTPEDSAHPGPGSWQ